MVPLPKELGSEVSLEEEAAKLIKFGLESVAKELGRLTDELHSQAGELLQIMCPTCRKFHQGDAEKKTAETMRELGLDGKG